MIIETAHNSSQISQKCYQNWILILRNKKKYFVNGDVFKSMYILCLIQKCVSGTIYTKIKLYISKYEVQF